MKKWQKKAIKEIMVNFDFKKVHKTMTFLDWRWGIEAKVPSLAEIKSHAKEKLKRVCRESKDRGYFFIDSGGFLVEAISHESKILRLSFVLSEWDTE